jgi:hypothetical protein
MSCKLINHNIEKVDKIRLKKLEKKNKKTLLTTLLIYNEIKKKYILINKNVS